MKKLVSLTVFIILTIFYTQLCLAQAIEEPKALDKNGKSDKEKQEAVVEGKERLIGRTFYVRQTVGNDSNDGLSPKTAWRSVSKLSRAMKAGDTAYVGPGLYREEILLQNTGTAENRITLIADTKGEFTGDPPGVVMLTGAEPVDENIFEPYYAPGVFKAHFPSYHILGVVEMDGDQYRYDRVTEKAEYVINKMSIEDVVAKFPSIYYYDEEKKVLYLHTSDGKHPNTHEMEIARRLNGIPIVKKEYIAIIGFTFRHFGDGGINFWESSNGIAINNTSFGNRQGIRVFDSKDILVYANTLFRNENCGVYFLKASKNGVAVSNIAYENAKGIRFGDRSSGMTLDNILFDNSAAGISAELSCNVLLRRNKMVNNEYQLLALSSKVILDGDCYQKGRSGKYTVEFFRPEEYYEVTDAEKSRQKDLRSKEGNCGPMPEKIDVRKLHQDTMTYTERARKILEESQAGKNQKQ
jgi:parallel beta-helix repeat protein